MNLLPFFKNRLGAQLIFIFAFLLPVLIVAVPLVILPVQKVVDSTSLRMRNIRAAAGGPGGAAPTREMAEQMDALRLEETYANLLLDLAKKDSVMLAINLRDSLVNLLIKGVPVRKCRISSFRMSQAIPHVARLDSLHTWLYPPFQLLNESATIPKAPIRIMDAPKDTIEAEAMAGQEIPIENNDVHFTMQFNRNLTVRIEQEQPPSSSSEFKKKFAFDMERIFAEARTTIRNLKRKRLPEHKLWIEVVVSREDAKAIYRAIPVKLQMALFLPEAG
ncbi:MAG TPA: hypothetical protein PLO28_05130 [bacterium]|nr:hypothetical protein [bacterium]HOZ21143.1 hypothetical protein [bacterium]